MNAWPLLEPLARLRLLGRSRSPRTWRDVASAASSVVAVITTLAISAYVFLVFDDGMKHHSIAGGDEGYFVWCGWCITKGWIPYRDFMEFKPPFVFLTHALAIKLYGFDRFQYRQLFTYFPLGAILALQLSLLSRRVDSVLAMGLTLGLIHLWVTPAFHDTALSDTESIGLSYYFLAVGCLLARSRFQGLMQGLGAALLVCCALSKEPFLLSTVVTWAACFFTSARKGSLHEDAVRYTKHALIGVGVVLVALGIYMVPTGAMSAYLRMVSRYAIIYRDPKLSLCAAAGFFEPTTPLNDLWRKWHAMVGDYASFGRVGFLVPFAVASILYIRRTSVALLTAAGLACVAGFLAVAASDCPWSHYYNMFLGGLFFAFALGLVTMTPYFRAVARSGRILIRFAMLTGLALAVWPRFEQERVAFGSRSFASPMAEPIPGSFEAVRKYTTPADRIVTSGNPIFYVQTNRRNAIRESNLFDMILGYYSGNTDYDELVKNRPKLVFLDPAYPDRQTRHYRALWAPFLADYHYTKLAEHIYLRPD